MRKTDHSPIRKVCVIGAGTMGAGIAAQIANAGLDVLLLDITGSGNNRNKVTRGALERINKTDPPLLMDPQNIKHINIGNIEDDLGAVDDCDWVVEAIVERLDIKRALYRNLLPHLKPQAVVSSNTSTIPISLLMNEMPVSLQRRFCITHFFNPVRYMRLLELVKGEATDCEVMEVLSHFCDRILGKGVVECGDTPGFLANRVGVFALQTAIDEAIRLGIKIEEADALFGRPMGVPKTGAFGLYDLIGLDLMSDVVRSLVNILPAGDSFYKVGGENALINSQIKKGFTGKKGLGGFYYEQEGKSFALDLQSGEWRERIMSVPDLALRGEQEGLAALVDGDDVLNQFCWRVLANILTYSARLLPDVTQSPQDIDDAMKLGYNWVRGPFEMLDELGVDWFVGRLTGEGWQVPDFLKNCGDHLIYRTKNDQLQVRHWDGIYQKVKLPQGVYRFHMLRQTLLPVVENNSASLFHLDDGIRLVEFHTKANVLDADCMKIVAEAAQNPGPGILVHNDAQHFSAGVNLEQFLKLIDAKDWRGIDKFLAEFQNAVHSLLYCDAPVVGAPSGLAIGGGFEVLAHCDVVVAHANCVLGLVEASVGLVPGGGGVKETYWRWYQRVGDWQKAAWNTFNQIGYGKTGSSPALASELCYFNHNKDIQVMNRDRLIEIGCETLRSMQGDYKPRQIPQFELAGGQVFSQMVEFLENEKDKGRFSSHNVKVASAIGEIVTGGEGAQLQNIREEDLFACERNKFIELAKTLQTKNLISSMLGLTSTIRK